MIPRRPKIRDRQAELTAPIVFFTFTILGAVYIVMAKVLNLPAFAVTLVPVALMLAYAGMILFINVLRLRDDQTGDNFYYMGFIFTLTSLAVSLYQYNSEDAIDQIISNFGIAVASTIAGISLRIFFNQMRRDPVEVEHYSRLDLAEASARVRRELDGMLVEFAHFRRTNQQMLFEGFQEIRDQVEHSTQATMTSMEALAREGLTHVRTANTTLTDQITAADLSQELNAASKASKRVATLLTKTAEQIGGAANQLAAKFSDVSSPDKVIEIKLQPTIDGLQATITRATEKLEAQQQQAQSYYAGMVQLADSLERSAADLARIAGSLEALRATPGRQRGFFSRFRRPEPPRADEQPQSAVTLSGGGVNPLREALDEKSDTANR